MKRITRTMQIVEFPDAAEALIDNHGPRLIQLLQFINSQHPAKQKKFWKYFDENTVKCANCDNRVLNHKVYKSQITKDCCSLGCSIEYAENHPIQSTQKVG